mgnify:CR=1 FL=1
MGALCQSDSRQNPITPLPHYPITPLPHYPITLGCITGVPRAIIRDG